MNRKSHPGFTVTEMIITMGVIAMLLGLLLPAVSGARQRARQMVCMDNLRVFGLAYNQCRLAGKIPKSDADVVGQREFVFGWPTEFMPYLEKSPKLFVCPETPNFSGQNAGSTAMVVLATPKTGLQYKIPVQHGNGRCRLANDNSLVGGLNSTESSYILQFEGQRDGKFDDLLLRIDPDPSSGSSTITVLSSPDTSKNTNNVEILVGGKSALKGTWGKLANKTVTVAGLGASTYGININAARMRADSHRVAILDYPKLVADTSVGGDVFVTSKVARHSGECNVLFVAGHVKNFGAEELNFNLPNIYNELWKPSADAPR